MKNNACTGFVLLVDAREIRDCLSHIASTAQKTSFTKLADRALREILCSPFLLTGVTNVA